MSFRGEESQAGSTWSPVHPLRAQLLRGRERSDWEQLMEGGFGGASG